LGGVRPPLNTVTTTNWVNDKISFDSTIASFGLGEQVENEGPSLSAKEIARKLLKLLQSPRDYRDNIAYWSRQSRSSSGAKGAARIIKQAALNEGTQYRKAFANNSDKRFMTTFTSEI